MARGFGAGVVWGLVVAVPGLLAWSQLAPPPASVIAAQEAAAAQAAADEQAAAKAAEEAAAAAAVAKAAEEEAAAAERAAAEKAAAEKAAAEKAAAEAQAPQVVVEEPQSPSAGEGTAKLGAPASLEDQPSLAGLDQALTAPDAEAELAPAPQEPAPAAPAAPGDVLAQPGQPAGSAQPETLPEIAPAEKEGSLPAPEAAEPEPEPEPEAQPEPSPPPTLAEDQPTLPGAKPLEDKVPTNVMDKDVPGVKVGNLPQIGDKAGADVTTEPDLALPDDLPPVQRFARDFTPEGKPLFAILLRDVGAEGLSRDELAALPFAVSFVIDPLAPDAAEASMTYRAAGQEVVMLANGIPQGATAGDVETSFATLARVLPESVALIDQDLGGFQDQRPLASLILPVIAGQGRGLVTYDRGLNAADQIARRDGLPSAVIFRKLDGEGESRQTIRRYLDRAAFKAAQEGAVVVIGESTPETVAAILEWTVEGKAATVSLAPITAVMGH